MSKALPTPRALRLNLAARLRDMADELSHRPAADETVEIDLATLDDIRTFAAKAAEYQTSYERMPTLTDPEARRHCEAYMAALAATFA